MSTPLQGNVELVEAERLPEPELFRQITPLPRNVSSSVRLIMFLHEESLTALVGFIGAFIGLVMLGVIKDSAVLFLALTFLIISLPTIFSLIHLIYSERRETTNTVQLLQNGYVGKGRFIGMELPKVKLALSVRFNRNKKTVKLKYQFAEQQGNPHDITVLCAPSMHLIKMSDNSFKPVFYDPESPEQNLLFDTLPRGIWYDEFAGTFRISSLRVMIRAFKCFFMSP